MVAVVPGHAIPALWSEQCNIDALFLCRALNSYHMYAAVRCGWGANLGGLAAHVIKVVMKGCSL